MNKREFVLGAMGGVGALSAAPARAAGEALRPVADAPGAESPAAAAAAQPPAWGREAWRRLAGAAFRCDELAASLVLQQVAEGAPADHGEQFALLFRSEAGLPAPAALLTLRHEASGHRMLMFVQGAGREADGAHVLRAEFNLLA